MDHTIVHFEIPADNVEKLKRFYSEVFGWKIEKAQGPIEYWLIETVPVDKKMMPVRPGVNGGMYKKDSPELKIVNYFSVENVDQFIDKITKLGGKIIKPKMQVPDVGWVAVAVDPEGNQFAILQPQQTRAWTPVRPAFSYFSANLVYDEKLNCLRHIIQRAIGGGRC